MKFFSLAIVVLIALSGAVFAEIDTSPCSDGTPYGKCSTANPGNWCTGSPGAHALMQYVALCSCTAVPGWIQDGTGDTATCVQATCDDGTKNGNCAKTKPKVCIGGSAYADNATKCGCPAGKRKAANGIFCESIPCNYSGEIVNEGLCSAKKAKMCQNGAMVDAATACGCPAGQTKVGEKCSLVCTDGTLNNACSTTKPRKCVDGDLVDDAQSCGCPSGQSAVGKNCAESVLGALGGVDLLGSGNTNANNSSGGSATSNPLSCCCLPTALIGIIGGFAFFRKEE
ncbi:MAG: hypothetical protein WCT52_00930 [Candidatus Micrarchaeia archaeon]